MQESTDMTLMDGAVDPPGKMALMLLTLGTIVLAPCLLTFVTGNKLWLAAWPGSIWVALFIIRITEPKPGRRPLAGELSCGTATIQIGGCEPLSEFAPKAK